MAKKYKLGRHCKLYRNSSTYASPTWNEMPACGDLSIPLTKGRAEFASRGSLFKAWKSGLIEAGVDFKMIYDTADEDFPILKDAFFDSDEIEFAIADGPIATAGTQYLRMTCEVFDFPIDEPLEEGCSVDVSIAPCPADNEPAWVTVPA
jgi:hypothetical protein